MNPPTQYILLAERHWRIWLPRRVAELERQGLLMAKLCEAAERTVQGLSPTPAAFPPTRPDAESSAQRAWEIARERYLFLPPED